MILNYRSFLSILQILWLSFSMSAQNSPAFFYGQDKRKVVTVDLRDSVAIIEFCHSNISGTWFTRFDTLKFSNVGYRGRFYEIVIKQGIHILKPGNIVLSPGIPDVLYNQVRNKGYSYYINEKLKRTLTWTGGNLTEFKSARWNQDRLLLLNPETFKQMANDTYDSLHVYYTSSLYSGKFKKLVIRDYRLIPKKYIDTSDSAKIREIWQLLSKSSVKDRNLLPYIIQYPIPVAALSIIDFEVALLASPLTYPALIGSEIFIGNRLLSRRTFKVIFYMNGKRQNVLKIRGSRIIDSDYIYQLSSDFKLFLSKI